MDTTNRMHIEVTPIDVCETASWTGIRRVSPTPGEPKSRCCFLAISRGLYQPSTISARIGVANSHFCIKGQASNFRMACRLACLQHISVCAAFGNLASGAAAIEINRVGVIVGTGHATSAFFVTSTRCLWQEAHLVALCLYAKGANAVKKHSEHGNAEQRGHACDMQNRFRNQQSH